MRDHDFERNLRRDLRDVAGDAPNGPTANDVMRTLDRRSTRRGVLAGAAGLGVAATLALMTTLLSDPPTADNITLARGERSPTFEGETTGQRDAVAVPMASDKRMYASAMTTDHPAVAYLVDTLYGAERANGPTVDTRPIEVDPRIDLRSAYADVLVVLASADGPLSRRGLFRD